jgi:hypothetical protein
MMKRFFLTIALSVAGAFALTAATPAFAGEKGCDCAKKAAAEKSDTKAGAKPEKTKPSDKAPAALEKKAENEPKCDCAKGGKGCVCKAKECKCSNCAKEAKFAAAAEGEKDCKGKCHGGTGDCTCPKGECDCKKKKAETKFAAADEKKPDCTGKCHGGKGDCTCAKGACDCAKHKKDEKRAA